MISAVGAIIGFIFGRKKNSSLARSTSEGAHRDVTSGFTNIVRFGAGQNGVMRTLGQYMLGSGVTFG